MLHPVIGMMSLDDLQLFVAVARARSFVAAARRLVVPTSTVSRRIAALEEALGARLLQRTSRRVGLTDDGARLFERASARVDELVAAVDQTMDREAEPAGRLRVTAPVLTGTHQIAPALFGFAAAHPKIVLELNLTNAVVPLVEAGYHLAFRAGPIRDRELIARKLWSMPQVFAAAPSMIRDHLGGKTRITRAALARVPAIVTRASRWNLVDRNGAIEEIVARDRVTVNDPRVAIAAAVAGLGVVCATLDALAEYGPSLVALTIPGRRPEPRDLFAVYPSRTLVPSRVRAALAWVIAHGRPGGVPPAPVASTAAPLIPRDR
jgi:DNA-binding transcriptional LysR family regulator